jgi:PIN domain
MFQLLIDTCVWLDVAKDPHQQAALNALEDLCNEGKVSLIVPRVVISEFDRNKERVAQESGRSLSSIFKRVKEAVERYGEGSQKHIALKQLNDVDHRIPLMGQAAYSTIHRIESLLKGGKIVETVDDLKLRAAQRAIDKRAPFHRARNGIDDAIIIEIYADAVRQRTTPGRRFAFISHNTKDFSHPNGSDLIPHPDIANLFSRVRSLYSTSLVKVLQRIEPDVVSEAMFMAEQVGSPRLLSELLSEEARLCDWVWYNRHWVWIEKIERGKHKIVPDDEWSVEAAHTCTMRSIFEGARRSATAMEKKYGRKNLGPWSDFEWGMINGKLSALRWVLGDDWDMLDT